MEDIDWNNDKDCLFVQILCEHYLNTHPVDNVDSLYIDIGGEG